MSLDVERVRRIVREALDEDIGRRDLTSEATVPDSARVQLLLGDLRLREGNWPAAQRARSTIAVTEPLPLVPATISVWKARWGLPSAAHSARMVSSPSLMPNCSRLKT